MVRKFLVAGAFLLHLSASYAMENSKLPLEIEMKMKLDDDNLKLLRHRLENNAISKGKETQKQYYLDDPEKSFLFSNPDGHYQDAEETFRVRISSKGDSLCLKQDNCDQKTGEILSREAEATINSGEKMIELLRSVGYFIIVSVEKEREKFVYGNLEIVIDEVKDFGTFVEVELTEQGIAPQDGIELIFGFLKEVGITKIIRYEKSYFHICLNPDYDFGVPIELR